MFFLVLDPAICFYQTDPDSDKQQYLDLYSTVHMLNLFVA
jgi:hypothetical protein